MGIEMALVENVLNREHISYTKLKKVRYSFHEPTNEIKQSITESVMPTSEMKKESWQKITKCENFKGIENKDGAIIIVIKEVTYTVV